MTDDPVRRLRLVTPTLDGAPVVTQVADMPDAYSVRRSGPAAALMARNRGSWVILFGYDRTAAHAVDGWSRQAVITGSHGDQEAAEIALALADAYDNPVTVYLDLIGAAVDTGSTVLVDLLRLHRPYKPNAGAPPQCAGDNGAEWHGCPTVKIIAGSLGVKLPDD